MIRAVTLAILLVGALWSVLPAAVWFADGDMDLYRAGWQVWWWGGLVSALVALLALLLSRGAAVDAAATAWRRIRALGTPWFVAGAGALLALGTMFASVILFHGNPRNVDGFAQLFHARAILAGALWAQPPALPQHFATLHMIIGPDRWLSQYPPGQPLLLAVGLALGAWWIVNPLIAAALSWAGYRVARSLFGEDEARLTALLLACSPFVLAVGGSELSHLPAATGAMGAAACGCAISGSRWRGAAVLAGVLLAVTATFRPLDAVAAAVPVAGMALLAGRARALEALALAAVSGAAGCLPLLWYNHETTGSWLRFGYTQLWGPGHSLGFHDTPWGTPLTPVRALGLTGVDLFLTNRDLFDLTVPLLPLISVAFFVGRRRLAVQDLIAVLGAATVYVLMFFYWHRDVFYGPRLHFVAAPWLCILFARAVTLLWRSPGPPSTPRAGRIAVFAVAVALAVGLTGLTPSRLAAYRNSLPQLSLHPDREARRAGISNAVVVIPDGWGSRLIARMWALGVPVRLSTRLYSGIDACTLQEQLDRAERDPAARERLVDTLVALRRAGRAGVRAGLTEDPNLRLPGRATPPATLGVIPEGGIELRPDSMLPPECLRELISDRRGFLGYAPYLYLNNATLDGDIVWARDLGEEANSALRARYPGRRMFRYAPPQPGAAPVFQLITP
ncbi:MAG TPA: hypothetical protein VNL98_13690 [Gemmatimonadales bacterium]|nr:hypothetical protein [Gemmatimonadales bacterium]